jgi:osmotically-inducible protein OsmY
MKTHGFRNLAMALGLLSTALLYAACRPNQTIEGQADDAAIKTKIKAKLASDVNLTTLTAVEVNVTNGVVTLAGPVHSDPERQQVEAAARAVEGVVSVTNNLQVLPPQAAKGPPVVTTVAPASGTPAPDPARAPTPPR